MALKLLLLADTHDDPEVKRTIGEALQDFGVDCIVHAGDFSVFGSGYQSLFTCAREHALPIVFSSGNHETADFCRQLEREFGGLYVDYRSTVFKGVRFTGIAGYDLSSPDRNSALLQFSRSLNQAAHVGFSILLTHKPPRPWAKDGVEFGSIAVADFIQKHLFQLVITGHIHETKPRFECSARGTPIINPGATGVLIEVDAAHRSFKLRPELG